MGPLTGSEDAEMNRTQRGHVLVGENPHTSTSGCTVARDSTGASGKQKKGRLALPECGEASRREDEVELNISVGVGVSAKWER